MDRVRLAGRRPGGARELTIGREESEAGRGRGAPRRRPDRRRGALEQAFARFDAINARDPRRERIEGREEPKELVYALRMSEMLGRFEPDASEALRLAARAQHIERWILPRSDFPEGRAGYKRWRARLMLHHAERAGAAMRESAYDEDTVERVRRLIRKQGLKRDPEVQALEDVVCLVFLEHYFDDFAEQHEDKKLVAILRKTWVKMSERGRRAALELELSERARGLVERAVGEAGAEGGAESGPDARAEGGGDGRAEPR